ncbi:MAG: alpha/beta fold hydrolase [Chloroflexota bacterium]|nr:MAG: hypothetical protein DLM70_10395 [Chloroflexota bacterium]
MSVNVQPSDSYFTVNGIHLHASAWTGPATGSPALLMLHGISDSWRVFTEVAPTLARDRTVYALDFRGHGESDKPDRNYGLTDYASDVSSLLAQLPHEQIDVLGHSLGGAVAVILAAEGPPKLRRLVLEDPPLLLGEECAEARDMGEHMLGMKRGSLEAIMEAYISPLSSWLLISQIRLFRLASVGCFKTPCRQQRSWTLRAADTISRPRVPTASCTRSRFFSEGRDDALTGFAFS